MRHPPVRVLLPGCPRRPWLDPRMPPASRYGHETADHRGRVRVWLGQDHPYANSGGWQYRSRLLVMCDLGRRLDPMEHVDHGPGRRLDDDRAQALRVLSAEYHGRIHASAFDIAGCRGEDGRFQELEPPEWPPAMVNRWKEMISLWPIPEAPGSP